MIGCEFCVRILYHVLHLAWSGPNWSSSKASSVNLKFRMISQKKISNILCLVVEPTHLKILVKMGTFPKVRGENISQWSNILYLVIQVLTFFGWWAHVTLSRGESWPPTFGDEKGTLNHLVIRFPPAMTNHPGCPLPATSSPCSFCSSFSASKRFFSASSWRFSSEWDFFLSSRSSHGSCIWYLVKHKQYKITNIPSNVT